MTPTDRARWLDAAANHEDFECVYDFQENVWFARTVYNETHDGLSHVYLEAPTLPELLSMLAEIFEP